MLTLWKVAMASRARLLQPVSAIKFTHDLHTQCAPEPELPIVVCTCLFTDDLAS